MPTYRRGRCIAAGIALSLTLTAACTGGHGETASTSTTPTSPAPRSTAAAEPVAGLPKGAAAHDSGSSPWPGGDVTAVSHAYTLTPSGPLSTPAHLTIALEHPVSAGTAVVVASREAMRQPWTYLPATLTADRAHASFSTSHFSIFTVLDVDVSAALAAFKSDFIDGVDAGITANAVQPHCDNESAAREEGYSVTSSSGDTVYWCLGLDGGRRTLTVANGRTYPLDVAHPDMDVLTDKIDYGSLASLSRLDVGGDAVVAPNGSTVFNADLSPGGSEGISTQIDGLGQSLYALQVGVTALVAILTRFGANPAGTPAAAV